MEAQARLREADGVELLPWIATILSVIGVSLVAIGLDGLRQEAVCTLCVSSTFLLADNGNWNSIGYGLTIVAVGVAISLVGKVTALLGRVLFILGLCGMLAGLVLLIPGTIIGWFTPGPIFGPLFVASAILIVLGIVSLALGS